MPQNPEDFSKEMPEWSQWKHEILDKYLQAFTGILQSYKTTYFVDGFAGAGKYDDGSKGSALRSAELAFSIKNDSKRSYNLHCINIEFDSVVYDKLVENTKIYDEFVTNYWGSFDTVVRNILNQVGDQPTLFFLDPFGVKELDWNVLLPIFERKSTRNSSIITEFLARFDVQALSRLHGCIFNEDEPSKRNVEVLLKVVGLDSVEDWLDIVKQTGDSLAGLTEAYQTLLRKHFDYVVRMPIKKTTGQLKYYLIFATRNEKAITVMNDTLYKVEGMRESVLDAAESSGQLGFFDLLEESFLLDELNTLKRLILSILPSKASLTRAKLITRVVHGDYFGAFSNSHFTAVLGGKPRSIKVPKEFVSLKELIQLNGAASDDKTIINRLE